ncbi:MAG: MinD/ParA family ATP-binding protein, partial [Paracoccaceae bacterium]
QDAFCANPKRSELRITPRSKPTTDAVLQTPTGAATGGYVNDFRVLDAGFGCSQFATAKGADLDELVVVLEDTVSRYSEAYQFIKNGLKQTGGRSFSILVNHGFCGNKAAEKYDRLNDLLTSIGGLSYRFIGFVPSFKNDPKFKTLETMALQNIAHELLDLKYDDKIHKIPKAMFEGALN